MRQAEVVNSTDKLIQNTFIQVGKIEASYWELKSAYDSNSSFVIWRNTNIALLITCTSWLISYCTRDAKFKFAKYIYTRQNLSQLLQD